MIQLPLDSNLKAEIATYDLFKGVGETDIDWFLSRAEHREYAEGEHLFVPGDELNALEIVLEGACMVKVKQGNEYREYRTWTRGAVIGKLPFSRLQKTSAYGVAVEKCRILCLHEQFFPEMAHQSYVLLGNCVAVMSDRIRDFTQVQLQNEKLMALGKLSAGLAHELNNPASAIVRSAEELYERTHHTPERFKAIITMRVTEEQTDAVNAILFGKIAAARPDLPLLQLEAKRDDILDWLEDHAIDNADDIAETFLEFGLYVEDLEKIEAIVEGRALGPILNWIENTLNLENTVTEIREAAGRIAELVRSVKAYTHMDQAQAFEPLDLHEGIKNTLTMLKHLIRQKGIVLEKTLDPNLPKISGNPGELNQVWTNLIDNAIDALPSAGTLKIRSFYRHKKVVIEIEDNGGGIPLEVQNQIFEPFFTTKPIGQGTGMGLEVVRRIVTQHHGEVKFSSQPGSTIFTIEFPQWN
jgi:signal transduction histidine kinase